MTDRILFEYCNSFATLSRMKATCACVLAVDIGVPTVFARSLLELARSRGVVFRADLKDILRQQEDLAHDLDRSERESIARFPGPLWTYYDAAGAKDPYGAFRPLVSQLGLMLSIYDHVLFRDDQRLHWVYQAALHSARGAARPSAVPLARFASALAPSGGDWAQALAAGSPRFESFEARASTQLHVLMYLGLAVAGGPAEEPVPWSIGRLLESTIEERQRIMRRLGALLANGLEIAPEERRGLYVRLLGDAPVEPWTKAIEDGMPVFLEWLEDRGGDEEALAQCAQQTLLDLDDRRYAPEDVDAWAARLNVDVAGRSSLRFRRMSRSLGPGPVVVI